NMKIKSIITLIFLFLINSMPALFADTALNTTNGNQAAKQITKPLYTPLIERYILDELKQLRQDQQGMKAELIEKVAIARLDASDRAIRYTADTTSSIFYIITAAASILVLLGWKSLRDIKDNIESITSKKLADLTQVYENRLDELERKIKRRSEQIIAAQHKIANTDVLHALWIRTGLALSEQEKIDIYDEILEINPGDIEALVYKADALLDLEEDKWALSLADMAIEQDNEYALAYWQRACAKAKLEQYDESVEDIKTAIELSESLSDEIESETYFEKLKDNAKFKLLTKGLT
ncbi:MAG: hypothetical protein KAG20_08550, partial [Cocleimonas sp.]|nr:hypothetical protein [Cocleimonas sp.]